jgi:predicted phosphodiesterase
MDQQCAWHHDAAGMANGIVRVVLTADNHLSAYMPKLSPARLAERRRRLGMAFKRTVDEALARRAHLFIQAGDLFDSVDPRNKEREFVAEQLARLIRAGVHTLAVSGNHDTPRQRTQHGGVSPQGVYDRLGGLLYFAESHELRPVPINVAGVRLAVAGLSSNPGAPPGADPLDDVELADSERVLAGADLGIVILHAAIEGHCFPSESESMIRRASLAKLTGFQVILAGHVHGFGRFGVGDKTVVVCGATEHMEFGGAEGAPGFAYLEFTRSGLRHAEHVPIEPQPRHIVTVRTTELWPPVRSSPDGDAVAATNLPTSSSVATAPSVVEGHGEAVHRDDGLRATTAIMQMTPADVLIQRLEVICTAEAMVRLCLEGPLTLDQYRTLDLRRIWLYGQHHAFSFEIDESGLFPASEGSQDVIARGERVAPREMLEQVARERMESAETPEERALLLQTRERVLARYDELVGREASQ